ncbi:hypothetical protein M3Y99_01836500 [Aphelenchoides fujianensis]|nr:hypothetical protein M3Y99_01836500 [Aphelenchoides fujianensis]
MKLLLVCLLIHSVGALPFVLEGTQRRWTADEQRAIHRERRKTHEAYEPRWPGAPVVARLSVGTPPRDFRVALETGTTAVFLLDADYPAACPSSPPSSPPARPAPARPATSPLSRATCRCSAPPSTTSWP